MDTDYPESILHSAVAQLVVVPVHSGAWAPLDFSDFQMERLNI